VPRQVKSRLLELRYLPEFVPEFLQFCGTVIAIILHPRRNYCDKPIRKMPSIRARRESGFYIEEKKWHAWGRSNARPLVPEESSEKL